MKEDEELDKLREDVLIATALPKKLFENDSFENDSFENFQMSHKQEKLVKAATKYIFELFDEEAKKEIWRHMRDRKRRKANIQMNRFFDGMVK